MTELGWSERKVGRQSTVSAQTVSNILRGRPANYAPDDTSWKPSAPHVVSIARALRAAGSDISVAKWLELAGHDPRKYTGDFADDAPVTSAEEFTKKVKALAVPDRRALETLVDSLLRASDYVSAEPRHVNTEPEMVIRSGPSEPTHRGVHAGPDEEVHHQADSEEQQRN